jgi:thymidylate kinase
VTIVCLEGPSAVGKTTAARTLAQAGKAIAIGEVNAIFSRPQRAPDTWYLERQVDRWQRALEAERTSPLVILDGDPFQPLWYNWIYPEDGLSSLSELEDFYRPRIVSGELGFPDGYVILSASREELEKRRASDRTRSRRHFEKHLRLIEPQQRYFRALAEVCPVFFLESDVLDAIERVEPTERRAVTIFEHAVQWLSAESAA